MALIVLDNKEEINLSRLDTNGSINVNYQTVFIDDLINETIKRDLKIALFLLFWISIGGNPLY